MDGAGVERAERNEAVANDAPPGIEDQHYKRFFAGIKPTGLRDVVAPVLSDDFGCVGCFRHGLAFADIENFEFVWGVGFDHEKAKGPDIVKTSGPGIWVGFSAGS